MKQQQSDAPVSAAVDAQSASDSNWQPILSWGRTNKRNQQMKVRKVSAGHAVSHCMPAAAWHRAAPQPGRVYMLAFQGCTLALSSLLLTVR